MIASKLPVLESGFEAFAQGRHLDAGAAKGIMYAKLQVGGGARESAPTLPADSAPSASAAWRLAAASVARLRPPHTSRAPPSFNRQVGSRQLYVFNTHLQASHSSASFSSAVPSRGGMGYRQLRQQQLAKIRQFVTEAARHSGVPWLL